MRWHEDRAGSQGLGVVAGRSNRVPRVQVASAVSCGPRSPLPGSAAYISISRVTCSMESGGCSLIRADPLTGVAPNLEADTFSGLFLHGLSLEVK